MQLESLKFLITIDRSIIFCGYPFAKIRLHCTRARIQVCWYGRHARSPQPFRGRWVSSAKCMRENDYRKIKSFTETELQAIIHFTLNIYMVLISLVIQNDNIKYLQFCFIINLTLDLTINVNSILLIANVIIQMLH